MSDVKFFAVQVAFPLYPGNPLHLIREAIAKAPENMGYQQKYELFNYVSRCTLMASQYFQYGVWEYIDDNTAESQFSTWVQGTFDDADDWMRRHPNPSVSDPYRGSNEARFGFVTQLFLIIRGSNTDRTLDALTDTVPNSNWTKAHLTTLIQGVGYINFANIREDAVFAKPGDDSYGLTQSEMTSPTYRHLRALG